MSGPGQVVASLQRGLVMARTPEQRRLANCAAQKRYKASMSPEQAQAIRDRMAAYRKRPEVIARARELQRARYAALTPEQRGMVGPPRPHPYQLRHAEAAPVRTRVPAPLPVPHVLLAAWFPAKGGDSV